MRGKRSSRFLAFVIIANILISLFAVPHAGAAGGLCFLNAAATPPGDGEAWETAYSDLHTALDNAACTEIWVAQGVYRAVREGYAENFYIPAGRAVYGGFEGNESLHTQRDPAAHVAVLSGDVGGDDVNTDGNFIAETWNDIVGENHTVVWIDGTVTPVASTTVLDGFTITAGDASGDYSGGLHCDGYGAGAQCSPTLSSLIFSGNRTESYMGGGGMYSYAGSGGNSSPMLTDVIFTGNFATYTSGGMAVDAFNGGNSSPTLTNVQFTGNVSGFLGGGMLTEAFDGGVSSPTLTNVTFTGNAAAYFGGGMFIAALDGGLTSATLTNVIFTDNHADYDGGGTFLTAGDEGTSSSTLTNVQFTGNHADRYGGALYNSGEPLCADCITGGNSSPQITDALFKGNSAKSGAAVYNAGTDSGVASPGFANVTFDGNTATARGGAVYNHSDKDGTTSPTFQNVTFTGNLAEDRGGGMFNEAQSGGISSPALTNVVFAENQADYDGGGMTNNGAGGVSSPTLANVTFTSNVAPFGGGIYSASSNGGVASPTLTEVTFTGNASIAIGGGMFNEAKSGGISSPTLTNVTFTDNRAADVGGGLVNSAGDGSESSPTLTNATFTGNHAGKGGAMYTSGNSSPHITNALFVDNTAAFGGAVYNRGGAENTGPSFTNVTFAYNTVTAQGGAVYNYGDKMRTTSPTFQNVTFSGNTSFGDGSAIYNGGSDPASVHPELVNTIIWDNARTGIPTQGFILTKWANTDYYYKVGDVITYHYTIQNTGTTPIDGPFWIWDDKVPSPPNPKGWPCTGAPSPLPSPSPVITCPDLVYTVTAADITAVEITNRARASNDARTVYSNQAIFTISFVPQPQNTLHKASALDCGVLCNANGATTSISYSVVQGGCAAIAGATCGSGNLSSDPLLADLADNGGSTQTMALQPGSSAIDAGSNAACPAADQRGSLRPADGNLDGIARCDIGAFEYMPQIFADMPVSGKEWMEPWVDAFYLHGITTGCGSNPLMYCPENKVTRAEAAVFLLRAKHGATYQPPAATSSFSDVPVSGKEWMQPWIEQFYREGLTTGCGVFGDGLHFCPENNVTRAEMAVFVLRALHPLGYQPTAAPNPFTDVPVAGKEWMAPWIIDFKSHGITTGCGVGLYCPENNVTRAEMAVFIGRAYQLYP